MEEGAVDQVAQGSGKFSRRDLLGATAGAGFAPLLSGQAIGARASKKLRLGVVGGGFGAAFFWHEHPGCVVTAVSDLRPERRHLLRERYRTKNVYEEFHPMLKDPTVDAVAIWTAAPDHAQHCIDALNAGKHVVCAVPAALTLEDCQRLVDTVRRTGLTYMNAETSCFHSATMTARKLREDGAFGNIYYTQGEYLHDLGEFHPGQKPSGLLKDASGKPTWRYGYPIAKYPTHALGPIVFVTGDRMTKVSGLGWKLDNEIYRNNAYHNPFVNVTFFGKTMGGGACRIAIHQYLGAEGDIAERAEYYGTKMLFIEPRFGQPAMRSHEGTKLETFALEDHSAILPPELRNHTVGGHEGSEVYITNEFVNAMNEGRRPLVDVFEAVAYCAPGICAHESALKDGDWVKVPDFGWHA
jgi:predicted dehydrogenase